MKWKIIQTCQQQRLRENLTVSLSCIMKKKQFILFFYCLFNIKYICDYEKACLSLDFVEKQFILKLPEKEII
jgi:hypothetical protein